MQDKEVEKLILKELDRERNYIDLIASENYASEDVLLASGSVFSNKYAEGYPHKRYYPGVEVVDELELLAIKRATQLFKCNYANVQPLTGSVANLGIYNAFLKPNDTILSMSLDAGGHLSHGSKVSLTGKIYHIVNYDIDKKTEQLDYDVIEQLAIQHQPKLIVAGASNYSRIIDWKRFREIADKVNAILLADISHISGLVVGNQHPDPFPYADVVMTTLQKMIRGARGALILWNKEEYCKKIDSAIFPGLQGGPQENIIAAKAVTFYEALKPSYQTYAKNVKENAQAICQVFLDHGFYVVSGGTDNHLFCVDVFKKIQITADQVENWLWQAHILANKNMVPFDQNSPRTPSGIRIGSPAMTTRGFSKQNFIELGNWMIDIILSKGDQKIINEVKQKVLMLLDRHPIYKNLENLYTK